MTKKSHIYMFYEYHKDHLGSSTQISDRDANIIHHPEKFVSNSFRETLETTNSGLVWMSFISDYSHNFSNYESRLNIEYMPSGEQFSEQRDHWATPYKFNSKELDAETGLYYYGARYYTPEIGIWLSVDPMASERSWVSPYSYCQNSPVVRVDPTGALDEELDTKYVTQKGELLYETNDGLTDVIIVKDVNIPKLEDKLKNANEKGTINDPEFNKKELHKLGQKPQEYSNEKTKGMHNYWANGYKETYEKAYKEGMGHFSLGQLFSAIVSSIASENKDNSGEMRHGGRSAGISDGNSDREKGNINRLNPYSSFKNNSPLIKLNTSKR